MTFAKGHKLGFKKGYVPWNKGKKTHTEEFKSKTSEMFKALWADPEYREKMRLKRMGHSVSDEARRKIGIAHKGMKHTEETKKALSEANRGPNAWNWKGGRKIVNGYVWMYAPHHPNAYYGSYVMEHRLVVEKNIGRFLLKTEPVHHLGKTTDNRAKKLMAFTCGAAHKKFHKSESLVKPEQIIFDGRKL